MNRIIDAKGKNCPIPVVMAKKEIDGGLTAFTIEVDNATAVENLQRLADSQGFRTTVQSGGGVFSIDFTKAPCEPCAAADAVISLFMNGGVKLPVHNEQIVEHLRELLTKGVEILVCGTCLNFYHLAEQLQVGTVSNMYEIVERMKQAGKVISL